MNKKNRRGGKAFANTLHREIFFLISLTAVVPAAVTAFALFYLIFSITAEQMGIPEAIGYNLIPAAQRTVGVLLVAVPICVAVLLFIAHRITHRIVGPFDRIVRELSEIAQGTRKGHIFLRKGDKFQPLVDKINNLIDKALRA
ncbi:MAG TPA: hypothetical protein PL155_08600 [Candidatus Omnitrophota bacterium]|nr:hypothetical protein [Candidatus Omnitrophota bacterium]HPD85486.1 hypothetical protein [Candidatus Omnitrophota bacterium]HRZ04013.1 hypothetical protein [Candidatus Omnitrophota bacterium]